MQDRIELLVEEKKQPAGVGLAVGVSFVLHALFLIWFVSSYRPAGPAEKPVPMARYVEFLKQNPREFTEAPGPKVDRAPLNAPLSDANRTASAPFPPNGDQPTKRPGDGSGVYNPPSNPAPPAPRVAQPPPVPQQQPQTSAAEAAAAPPEDPNGRFVYREQQQPVAQANAAVDWRKVVTNVNEVGKIASLGGDGIDLGRITGGDKGTFDQGPLSFESNWYDWGEYAQSMVSKIRVNWYANMPQLIRTGMQGVVTIRFTIQRDGRITDVQILDTSTVPPYDFAARKAIELSSPLNPLPRDFPNPYERVTAMFFYNKRVPEK